MIDVYKFTILGISLVYIYIGVGYFQATMEPIPNIPVDKSLAEKFKKPEGSWECDTCMVNNSSTATKCIACETPKPGETKATSKLILS